MHAYEDQRRKDIEEIDQDHERLPALIGRDTGENAEKEPEKAEKDVASGHYDYDGHLMKEIEGIKLEQERIEREYGIHHPWWDEEEDGWDEEA